MFGNIKNHAGVLFQGKNYKTIKKVGVKGDKIASHNHIGEDVVFTLIKGNVIVHLNDLEDYELKSGDILNFNGENTLSVDFLEDSEIVINLILN